MTVTILSMLGVAIFAISGGLAAGHKGLDWIGVVVLAVVTSLGGGTIRDILLNRDTLFWIQEPMFLWEIIASSCFTIVYVKFFKPPLNSLLIADALGLALFTILGAQVAEAMDVSGIIIVGGIGQLTTNVNAALWLGIAAVFFATLNIAGGFLVTQRMLKMFQK